MFGTTSRKGKGKLIQESGMGRKRPFDLSLDEDEEEDGISSHIDGGNGTGEASLLDDDSGAPAYNDDSVQINGDQSLEVPDETLQELSEIQEQSKAHAMVKKRGRPKAAAKDSAPPPPVLAENEPSMDAPTTKKRTGRPKKQVFDIPESEPASVVKEKGEAPKKRGRKKVNVEVHHDDEQDEGEAGPSKPAKRPRTDPVEVTPTKKSRKAKKPPPSERDPNARITSAKGKGKGEEKEKAPSAEPASSASFVKPKSRSLYVLRHETPAEDDGSRLLRSGRHSVKPIAYWRGERIVYGDSHLDGKNIILAPIREVIRTEEVVDARPKKSYRRLAGRPAVRRPLDDVDEEDEDQEPWELGEGVLRAEVMQWDPVEQKGSEENIEHVG